jgi:hypothetical protein
VDATIDELLAIWILKLGGGGSDLTWEAVAAVSNDYNWGGLHLGYRYIHLFLTSVSTC